MAITLINLSGYQFGIEAEETALNVKSFDVAYKPEFKEWLRGKTNEKIGFALAPTEAEITLEAEIKGSLTQTFATAATLANDTSDFGAAGAIYLDEATVKQARDGWRSLSAKYSRCAGIPAA